MELRNHVWQTRGRRHRLRLEVIEEQLTSSQLTVWVDISDTAADARALGRLRAAVLSAAQRAGWSQPVAIVESDTLGLYDMASPASVDEAIDVLTLFRRAQ